MPLLDRRRQGAQMIGLTTEVTSIAEALQKLHSWTVSTFGKAPKKFHLGEAEISRLRHELKDAGMHTENAAGIKFLDIPIEIVEGTGVGAVV